MERCMQRSMRHGSRYENKRVSGTRLLLRVRGAPKLPVPQNNIESYIGRGKKRRGTRK
jgi:hypothetical protein